MSEVQWTKKENGTYVGYDDDGNTFWMPANQETVEVQLADGRQGHGWTIPEAIKSAQQALKTLLDGTKPTNSAKPNFPHNSYNKLKILEIASLAAPCGSSVNTVIEYYRAFLAELSASNSESL